jgi:hypothetical protein
MAHSRRLIRYRLTPVSLLAGVLFCAQIAMAREHPADEGRMETVFRVVDGRLTWTQSWWFGNLIGQRFWYYALDTDRDALLGDAEREAFAQRVLDTFTVELDGVAAGTRIDALDIADFNAFISLPTDPQVRATFSAPLSGEQARLIYRKLTPDPLSFLPRFPGGDGVLIRDQVVTQNRYEATLRLRRAPGTLARDARAQTAQTAYWVAIGSLVAAAVVTVLVIILLWRLRRLR